MTRELAGAVPVRHPKGELITWREHPAVNRSPYWLCRFDSCLAHLPGSGPAAERPKPGRPSSTLGGETRPPTPARSTMDVRLPPEQTVANSTLAGPTPVFRMCKL